MTNEQKNALYDEVDGAMAKLSAAQRKFLEKTGWTYSSSHPDHRWRWSKKINGVNYSFGPEEAIDVEIGL